MDNNYQKIKSKPKKIFVKNGMHHLINFLSEVERKLDASGGADVEKSKLSIIDFWEPLNDFLIQFVLASGNPVDFTDFSPDIKKVGDGGNEKELTTIDMGGFKLEVDADDFLRYYKLMKLLRKKNFTGDVFHYHLKGEERTVTTSVNFIGGTKSKADEEKKSETKKEESGSKYDYLKLANPHLSEENLLNIIKAAQVLAKEATPANIKNTIHNNSWEVIPASDGRHLEKTSFLKNAIGAIKNDFHVAKPGAYELVSLHKQIYLIEVFIGTEEGMKYLMSFPPALKKWSEEKIELKNDLLIHSAEYKVRGINFPNWTNSKYPHTLSDVIRSFIINYGIIYKNFNALTKCFICKRIIFPKKKAHRSFCSQKCRSINHEAEFGEDKLACFSRQKHWFSYNLRKDSEAKNKYSSETVTISSKECTKCERYWQFGKIPGGMCDVFIKKYGIKNSDKKKWIEEETAKLAQKTAADEKAFQEEFAKLMARKTDAN